MRFNVVLRDTSAMIVREAKAVLSAGMALLRCHSNPPDSLLLILRDTCALGVTETKVKLPASMPSPLLKSPSVTAFIWSLSSLTSSVIPRSPKVVLFSC